MSKVISLKEALQSSLVHIEEKKRMAERDARIKEMQSDQGKAQIQAGIRVLQHSIGPDATLAYLRAELEAIGGISTVGSEEH